MASVGGLSLILWSEGICPYLDLQDHESLRQSTRTFRSVVQLALPKLIARLEDSVMELSMSEQLRLEDEEDSARPTPQTLANMRSRMDVIDASQAASLKSMKSPTPPVLDTMEVLRVMLDMPKNANPFVSPKLLGLLMTFDPDHVNDKTWKALERYVKKNDVQKVKKASAACGNFCEYLHALFQYASMLRPKVRKDGVRAVMKALQRVADIAKRLESRGAASQSE